MPVSRAYDGRVALSVMQRSSFFGKPGAVDRVTVTTPWGIKVVCHRAVAALFLEACEEAARTCKWRPRRIDGYNHRPIRGSAAPSLHGYALAWDFFATPPNVEPPGGVWTPHNALPSDFALCFTRRGFTWGAFWRRKDVPHIEWAGPPPAARASTRAPAPAARASTPAPPADPPAPTPAPDLRSHEPVILNIKGSPYNFFVRGCDTKGDLVLLAVDAAEFWELAGAGMRVICVSHKTFDRIRKGNRWGA
jgi:hypothetical protein